MRAPAGVTEIVVCTLTWGTIGLVRKQLSLPSSIVAFFRLLLGMLVVAAWLAARGRLRQLRPGPRPVLLATAGVVLGVHWVLEFEAFRRLDVAAAILIVFLGPVLWALAGPSVLGESLRPSSIAALGLAFGGLTLIAVPDFGGVDALGLASAIGAAVSFAVLILVGKVLTRDYQPATLVVWELGVGALVVSPALAGASSVQIGRALPALVLLGVVHTGLLGILFFRAVRALGAQQLGVLFYLEPASAVLYAWVLLSETPSLATLAGGALIVAGGVVIIASERAALAPAGLPEPFAAQEDA